MASNEYIDELLNEYGILDSEGFLVGTDHPNIKTVYNRIDNLSKKINLTPEEIEEAIKLTIINKAYIKEINKYLLEEAQNNEASSESSGSSGYYRDSGDEDDTTLSSEYDTHETFSEPEE